MKIFLHFISITICLILTAPYIGVQSECRADEYDFRLNIDKSKKTSIDDYYLPKALYGLRKISVEYSYEKNDDLILKQYRLIWKLVDNHGEYLFLGADPNYITEYEAIEKYNANTDRKKKLLALDIGFLGVDLEPTDGKSLSLVKIEDYKTKSIQKLFQSFYKNNLLLTDNKIPDRNDLKFIVVRVSPPQYDKNTNEATRNMILESTKFDENKRKGTHNRYLFVIWNKAKVRKLPNYITNKRSSYSRKPLFAQTASTQQPKPEKSCKSVVSEMVTFNFEQSKSNRLNKDENDAEFSYLKDEIKNLLIFTIAKKEIKYIKWHNDSIKLPTKYLENNKIKVTIKRNEFVKIVGKPTIKKGKNKISFELIRKKVTINILPYKHHLSLKLKNSIDVKLKSKSIKNIAKVKDDTIEIKLVEHTKIDYNIEIRRRYYNKVSLSISKKDIQKQEIIEGILYPIRISCKLEMKQKQEYNHQLDIPDKIRIITNKNLFGSNECNTSAVEFPLYFFPLEIKIMDKDKNLWEFVKGKKIPLSAKGVTSITHPLIIKRVTEKKDFHFNFTLDKSIEKYPINIKFTDFLCKHDSISRTLRPQKSSIKRKFIWPKETCDGDNIILRIDKGKGYDITDNSPNRKHDENNPVYSLKITDPNKIPGIHISRLAIDIFYVDITNSSLDRMAMKNAIISRIDQNESVFIHVSNGQEHYSGTIERKKEILNKIFMLDMLTPNFQQDLKDLSHKVKESGMLNPSRKQVNLHLFLSSATYHWVKSDEKSLEKTFRELGLSDPNIFFYVEETVLNGTRDISKYKAIPVDTDKDKKIVIQY